MNSKFNLPQIGTKEFNSMCESFFGGMSLELKNALSWWDRLRSTRLSNGTKDKGYYCDKYFGCNMRMYQYLSNEDILHIYSSEHKNNR